MTGRSLEDEAVSTAKDSNSQRANVPEWLKSAWAAARSSRGWVTAAMLMAMTVAALEQTVVATAQPSIISQLKGMELYSWVMLAYLLASTVTTPIYGKLADRLGRKRVLLFGLGLFAVGSMLCGLAQTMPQLIAMRIVQGLGAGAIGPVVLTMLGDMFSLEERAKVQGLFSAVWGLSTLAGPFIGGKLTDELSWRWVFFVTTPFSIVSAWILVTQVHEPPVTKRDEAPSPIDWIGASLLSIGTILALIAMQHGGGSPTGTLAMFAVAAVALVWFVQHERQVDDPVLPIDLFRIPNIAASAAGSVMIGAILVAIDIFVPLHVQGVKGLDATQAGRTLTPLLLTWACSVAVAARVVVRLGFRRTALLGSTFVVLGTTGLVLGAANPEWSRLLFLVSLMVIGLGMGPTSLSYILDVQNTVERARRGSATGAVIFARTMGGSIGIGILGASLSRSLAGWLASTPGIDVAAALRPETHARLNPEQLLTVQDALGRSLRDVFLQIVAMALLAMVCSLGLRGGRAVSHADAGAGAVREDENGSGEEGMSIELAAEL